MADSLYVIFIQTLIADYIASSSLHIRLPWFRVHIVLLNDPGRLISAHIVHTGLVAGWASVMLIYECLILDNTDQVFDPIWRQGCFVLQYASRLGVVSSNFGWSLGISPQTTYWTYEAVIFGHIILSGLLVLASCWHWSYWI
jgi:photosystem II CP47 chlorophyll apoprotein